MRYADAPAELRRSSDGGVITTFQDTQPASITFSPDGTVFVVRYPKGLLLDVNAPAESELRRTENGTLLATLGGDIPSGDIVSSAADLNFHGTVMSSSNGKNGVSFSPDGSTVVVRYARGRGELWDTRGTPRRLADLGLGLEKASFVFSSGVERLAVQYGNGQLYLLDVAWLRKMGGDPGRLAAEELVRLACEGPVTRGPWTTAEQEALDGALDRRKPQSCSSSHNP